MAHLIRASVRERDKNRRNDTGGVDTPWVFAYRVYAADIFDFRRVSNLMEINDGSEIEGSTPRDKKNTPECILPLFARLFAFTWQESSCLFFHNAIDSRTFTIITCRRFLIRFTRRAKFV